MPKTRRSSFSDLFVTMVVVSARAGGMTTRRFPGFVHPDPGRTPGEVHQKVRPLRGRRQAGRRPARKRSSPDVCRRRRLAGGGSRPASETPVDRVLQAGETQGLRWELTRIGQELHAQQVILFIPFGIWFGRRKRDELYNEFRIWAEECLPTRLPEEIGKARFIYFTTVGLGWRAHLLMRKGKIVARHPLWPVLESLQKTKSIWPGSGTILEKSWRQLSGRSLSSRLLQLSLPSSP